MAESFPFAMETLLGVSAKVERPLSSGHLPTHIDLSYHPFVDEPDIVDPGSTIPPSPGMSLYPMQGISQSLPVQPEPERPLASSPFIPTKASTSTNPGSGSGSAQSVAQPTPGTDAPPPRHVQPKATSVMDEDAEAALEVEPAPGFGSGAGLGAGVAPLGDEDGLPPRKTAKVTDSCTAQV